MQPPEVDEMLKQKICWQITDPSVAYSAHQEAPKCWGEAPITVLCHGSRNDLYLERPKVFQSAAVGMSPEEFKDSVDDFWADMENASLQWDSLFIHFYFLVYTSLSRQSL